jgi:hypothetical protein
VQSGVGFELAKTTYSIVVERDAVFLGSVTKYRDMVDMTQANKVMLLFVRYVDDDVLDYIEIPNENAFVQGFGFVYRRESILRRLTSNMLLKKGTVLATPKTVDSYQGYKPGKNVNVLYAKLMDVGEDGDKTSESFMRGFSYDYIVKRSISYGENSIPCNSYGTLDNFKPFPSIGEKIRDDGLLFASRRVSVENALATMGRMELMEIDDRFDDAVYAPPPTPETEGYEIRVSSGIVTDIEFIRTSDTKKTATSGINELSDIWVTALRRYHEDIRALYNDIQREARSTIGGELVVSDQLTTLLNEVDHLLLSKEKIKILNRKDPVDIYRADFTIVYRVIPGKGAKFTGEFGNKGVSVSGVVPDEEMPFNSLGIRADLVRSPETIGNRLIPGALYSQAFTEASRTVKYKIAELFNSKCLDSRGKVFERPVSFPEDRVEEAFRHINTVSDLTGFNPYKNLTYSEKVEVICSILADEFYLKYNVESEAIAGVVAANLAKLGYSGNKYKTFIKKPRENISDDGVITITYDLVEFDDEMIISPAYIYLIAKTADEYSVCASAKTNHFDMPSTGSGRRKHSTKHKDTPAKVTGETERRLSAGNTSMFGTAHHLDMITNKDSHKETLKGILEAEKPSNIECLIDRRTYGFKPNGVTSTIEALFNAHGSEFVYDEGDANV